MTAGYNGGPSIQTQGLVLLVSELSCSVVIHPLRKEYKISRSNLLQTELSLVEALTTPSGSVHSANPIPAVVCVCVFVCVCVCVAESGGGVREVGG